MKIIRSKKELEKYVWNDCNPYDVDEHFCITDVDYKYPIILKHMGINSLGTAYRVITKDDVEEESKELEKFKQLLKDD